MAKFPVVQLNSSILTPELSALIYASKVTARFRFELLTNANVSKGYLNCVLNEGGSVENNYLADVKRTCSFTVGEAGNFFMIDFQNDRIKIYYEIFSAYRNSWLAFPLGVYLMSAGNRSVTDNLVTRSVTGTDLSQVLRRRKHYDRFIVPAGSDPIAVVRGLLDDAGLDHNIFDNPDLPNDITQALRTFDPGQEILTTINTLLAMVNYRSLYFDNNGVAVSEPYVAPQDRIIELGYVTDDASIVFSGANLELTLNDIPNIVQVVVSQPDRAVITATARNDNPDSPVSTVNAPDTLYVVSDNEDVTTEAQAKAKAARVLAELNQVYETIQFSSATVPLHDENTMLGITHTDLGISDTFNEIEWRISLTPGDLMTHKARRLVTL